MNLLEPALEGKSITQLLLGLRPVELWSDRVYAGRRRGSWGLLYARLMALLLLIPALPVLGLLYVLHRLIEKDEGGFLYCGERLGKDGRPFTIYKIRTLKSDAAQQLTGQLHQEGSHLELRMGRFLRATRLDELPQLFNILKGDMVFIGPRPERPCVYAKECRHIPGYDRRFDWYPGLTGPSQFLTPHGTPKRLRARLDNLLLSRHRTLPRTISFVLWTVFAVLRNSIRESLRILIYSDHSHYGRRLYFSRHHSSLSAWTTGEDFRKSQAPLTIVDASNTSILAQTIQPLDETRRLHFVIEVHRKGKRRRVRCRGSVRPAMAPCLPKGPGASVFAYEIAYEPASSLHRYLMESYVLRKTIA